MLEILRYIWGDCELRPVTSGAWGDVWNGGRLEGWVQRAAWAGGDVGLGDGREKRGKAEKEKPKADTLKF